MNTITEKVDLAFWTKKGNIGFNKNYVGTFDHNEGMQEVTIDLQNVHPTSHAAKWRDSGKFIKTTAGNTYDYETFTILVECLKELNNRGTTVPKGSVFHTDYIELLSYCAEGIDPETAMEIFKHPIKFKIVQSTFWLTLATVACSAIYMIAK